MSWGPEHWSALGNVAMALAAIAGAAAAFAGLNTWKNQLKWQSDNDLAKRVMLASLRYRDAISALRDPKILGVEMAPANGSTISPAFGWDGTATAIFRRLTRLQEMRSELDSTLQEVEAHWDNLLKQPFGAIFAEEDRLVKAMHRFLQSHDPSLLKDDRDRARERAKEEGNIHFTSTVVEPDEFTAKLEELLSKATKILHKKLDRTP